MSTVVERAPGARAAANGSSQAPHRRPPLFPFVAAPGAALAAAVLAGRLARRRQGRAARPEVNWSFAFASGNQVQFRPTLAPRFTALLLRRRNAARAARLLRRRAP